MAGSAPTKLIRDHGFCDMGSTMTWLAGPEGELGCRCWECAMCERGIPEDLGAGTRGGYWAVSLRVHDPGLGRLGVGSWDWELRAIGTPARCAWDCFPPARGRCDQMSDRSPLGDNRRTGRQPIAFRLWDAGVTNQHNADFHAIWKGGSFTMVSFKILGGGYLTPIPPKPRR